jgi:hemolysin III
MDARLQSPGEEIANSLIHGIALLAVAIAVPVLIVTAVRHGGAVNVAAASVPRDGPPPRQERVRR